ncbi:DUF6090 family protein [bacterium]|nr:DUF6090 family protein [bacterium]
MIKFFRKIRQRLLTENKFSKYLIYAIGEIVLVVIGIVIALQLNNWNETRKSEDQFKAVLQQLYAVIDQDIERLTQIQYGLAKQIAIIDTIKQRPENINPKLLPHLLFYIDLEPTDITSEVSYHLGFLNFNPANLRQSNLNKSLSSYGNSINENFRASRKYVTSFLEKNNLPFPSVNFGHSVVNNYEFIDTNFFSDSEIEHAAKFLEDPLFHSAMKSLGSRKAWISSFVGDLLNLAKANLTAIKIYYPDVKLLYGNVGLVGDATQNNNWSKNIPLTLTNDLESIWEADVVLKNGFVKFREGENWYFNWGGDEFPEGNTQAYYGNNISVKAGKYHVILNLSEKTYQFIKQDN